MLKGIGLQTMPCWYYEKKELRHTPSMTQGMQVDQENSFRREGARFILQVGNKMGLKYETMATGVVYFHRFYMVHTFQEFPRHVTACCCLFLAGKVEETPKKCKDIMKTARGLIDNETWAEFGEDSREEVMTLERILLQTIKFDFIVEHPYSYLLKYAKSLKGDKKKLHHIVQMAWTFVNDSLCTTLCLQWEPEIIAIALMYLAGKLNKFEVTDWHGRNSKQQKWWDMFVQGISLELLEDICHQVLDLYSSNKAEGGAPGLGPGPEGFTLGKPKMTDAPKKSQPQPLPSTHTTPAADQPSQTKKTKKDDSKNFPTPAKAEAQISSYSYQQSQYAANFPPAYPPPANVSSVQTTSAVPARYPYTYQPPPAPPRYPQTSVAPQPPPPPPVTTVSPTAAAIAQPIYHHSHYQSMSYPPGTPTSHYPPQQQSHAGTPTTPTHRPPPTNFPPPHVATPYYHTQATSGTPRQPHYQQPTTPYGSASYTPRTYYPPPT